MVLGIEHHALASTQFEHGLADASALGALPHGDIQSISEFGVGHRLGEVTASHLEGYREDDEPVWFGFEDRMPVVEAAITRGEDSYLRRPPVEHGHSRDDAGDIPPIRPDVLDRCRADTSRYPRQRLHAPPLLGDAPLHEIVPGFPRLHLDPGAAAAFIDRGDAASGDLDHRSIESAIRHNEIAASADQQDVLSPGIAFDDRSEQFRTIGGGQPSTNRTPHPEGGPSGEGFGHARETMADARPSTPWPSQVAVRSKRTKGSSSFSATDAAT